MLKYCLYNLELIYAIVIIHWISLTTTLHPNQSNTIASHGKHNMCNKIINMRHVGYPFSKLIHLNIYNHKICKIPFILHQIFCCLVLKIVYRSVKSKVITMLHFSIVIKMWGNYIVTIHWMQLLGNNRNYCQVAIFMTSESKRNLYANLR